MKKLTYIVLIALGLLTLAPALVSAQSALGTAAASVSASASVTTPVVTASTTVKMSATAMATAKSRGNQELERRITALQAANTRVQAMQEVTATFKENLANAIQTQISAFQALDTKIQADTDAATLKADVQSITESYRVYALVLPQVRIAAAADRGVAIASMMQALGTKLETRVQAESSAGVNVTAMTAALTDLASKISDASTQSQAAVSVSAPLTPDNGVASVMASNETALKQARADLTTVQTDLKAARADITTITKFVEANEKATASASATTTVSQ